MLVAALLDSRDLDYSSATLFRLTSKPLPTHSNISLMVNHLLSLAWPRTPSSHPISIPTSGPLDLVTLPPPMLLFPISSSKNIPNQVQDPPIFIFTLISIPSNLPTPQIQIQTPWRSEG